MNFKIVDITFALDTFWREKWIAFKAHWYILLVLTF